MFRADSKQVFKARGEGAPGRNKIPPLRQAQDPGLISLGIDHPDGMTSKKPRVGKKLQAPLRRYAVHILVGDVHEVEVMARNKLHASRLAEAEYARCGGDPGEVLECDHLQVACFRMEDAR